MHITDASGYAGHADQVFTPRSEEEIAEIVTRAGRESVPMTIMGLAIVMPYPWVAYQGWIGGIVSVRGDHSSRLADLRPHATATGTLIAHFEWL